MGVCEAIFLRAEAWENAAAQQSMATDPGSEKACRCMINVRAVYVRIVVSQSIQDVCGVEK
jgi:hypothetical protein